MMGIATNHRVPEFEQLVDKELSHTLSQTEDDNFCADLSATLKQLSQKLNTRTVGQYERIPSCVRLCYDEDSKLTDMCRVLFAGYKLILPVIEKKETQHQSPGEVPEAGGDKPDSTANQSGFAKIVPAVAEVKRPAATDEIKDRTPIPVSNDTAKIAKKDETDKSANPSAKSVPPSSEIIPAKNPEAGGKTVPVAEVVVPKTFEKATRDHPPAPVQPPLEAAVVPEKNEDDLVQQQQQQQQGGDLDTGGDVAPFDDEPKPAGNLADGAAKGGATQTQYENSDESEAIASAEDVNENGDDLELNGFQPVGKPAVLPEKVKQDEFSESSKASDIVPGADPFYEQKDSNFFPYFLFAMFSCAMLYVAYHNKSKLLALVVEGRRTSSGRGGFSKGRKHTAAYRKLDSNLEEAITSGSGSGGHSSSQIIY
uniref:Uncharacterized protein n=1 Tax=Anopheles stephensi TaxID=30069 RepID=A0A182Y8L1_ANOST